MACRVSAMVHSREAARRQAGTAVPLQPGWYSRVAGRQRLEQQEVLQRQAGEHVPPQPRSPRSSHATPYQTACSKSVLVERGEGVV